jgi:hypothetical protein
MPRRTAAPLSRLPLLAGAAALAALATLTGSGAADAATEPGDLRPSAVPPAKSDYLSITVQGAGDPGRNRTYSLFCHPAGGTHPQPQAACEAVDAARADDERARRAPAAGPFAPVPSEAICTMVHGGPATARITGIWHGRSVNAHFDRSNGCEMSRWDRLVPALPALG